MKQKFHPSDRYVEQLSHIKHNLKKLTEEVDGLMKDCKDGFIVK